MEKMESQPSYASPPYPYPQPPPPSMPSYPQPPPSMPPPNAVYTVVSNIAFGKESQHMTCPHCHADISTRIESEANTKTHMIALLLCVFGCCCCVPCVYCMDSCTVQKHFCPACNAYLGESKN